MRSGHWPPTLGAGAHQNGSIIPWPITRGSPAAADRTSRASDRSPRSTRGPVHFSWQITHT